MTPKCNARIKIKYRAVIIQKYSRGVPVDPFSSPESVSTLGAFESIWRRAFELVD